MANCNLSIILIFYNLFDIELICFWDAYHKLKLMRIDRASSDDSIDAKVNSSAISPNEPLSE